MAIKEISTNHQVYYKTMQAAIRPKYDTAVEEYDTLLKEERALYEEVKQLHQTYSSVYKIKLTDYSEFVDNEYKDGVFFNTAKSLFVSKKNNYLAKSVLYKLYKLARLQKDIHDKKHDINLYERMLDLTITQYKRILEVFYNEVMREMIIDGVGYVFENPIGWICINRCKIKENARKTLDFQATKRNKAKLLAEGKRLWNKEEAEYAARVGIEYEGVDYRVYLDSETCYEIPLINCRLPNGSLYDFKTCFARRHVTGKTEEQVLEECHYNMEEVCNLTADIRYKLKLCLKIDNLLYLNFIRNDAQQSAHTPKANRKSR